MNLITNIRDSATISLCNLASINLCEYYKLNQFEREKLCQIVVNTLTSAVLKSSHPILDAKHTNESKKYLGIGVLNLANALAENKLVIDTQEALEWQDQLFDDLSYNIYKASMEYAKTHGSFEGFEKTKWAEGLTPVHLSRMYYPNAWRLTEYGKNFNMTRWDKLGQDIKKYGIGHAQLMAIAPTSTSGKAINSTESTEPIAGFSYKEEGVFNVSTLVPNFEKNVDYYKPSFECEQKHLINNAIIRQKYLDQAQSVTLYLKSADSLRVLTNLHNYGFEHGIKTFYYLKQQKMEADTETCEACAM